MTLIGSVSSFNAPRRRLATIWRAVDLVCALAAFHAFPAHAQVQGPVSCQAEAQRVGQQLMSANRPAQCATCAIRLTQTLGTL